MNEREIPKSEVPQINKVTGLSSDYFNNYEAFRIYFILGEGGKIVEELSNHPVRNYTEYFPENLFANVITENNKAAIADLSELTKKFNSLGKAERLDRHEFIKIFNEAQRLVLGPNRPELTLADFGKIEKK